MWLWQGSLGTAGQTHWALPCTQHPKALRRCQDIQVSPIPEPVAAGEEEQTQLAPCGTRDLGGSVGSC